MPSQIYSLIATPVLTGLVGYCTNWLAIKMLFRPHKKSLWSFGWQGVIPKNRSKLASEIGVLVGSKLLRQEDISSAFFSESVQEKLERAVETELKTFLEKDFGTLRDIIEKTGLQSRVVISALLEAVNSGGALDELFDNIKKSMTDKLLGFRIGELEEFSENITAAVSSILGSGHIQNEAVNSISASINNFVMSGKSLGDILPDSLTKKTSGFAEFITDKILVSLDKAMSDPDTRKKISRKLADIKNNHFSDGAVDQIKLGFLNMFMNEDTITEMVDKYLPKLVVSIKESPEVKAKISLSIADYITGLINKPLFMHADAIGLEALFQLRTTIITAAKQTLDSAGFTDKISNVINDLISKNSDKTIGCILSELGLDKTVQKKINSSGISTHDLAVTLDSLCGKMRIHGIYSVIPKKLFYSIKTALLGEINKVVDKNTAKILEAVNFPKITEDRINSLNLYEVENLLFSFMKDSFRWINILGFILGFLFGAVQSALFYFLG